jgi:sucrose-6-phosphate hydrolase SacC (GH32 family)
VLEAGEENRLRFYYDRKQSLLVLDYGQSNALGKSAVETELKLAPEEEADLRLFFDASVIEVFANGKRSFGRWYTGSPADIRVGLFSENAPTVFSRADVWEMGTIWKEYTGKPADAE